MKACTKCKVPKDIDEFSNDCTTKSGKKFACKECSNKVRRAYVYPKDAKKRHAKADKERHHPRILITGARARAKKRGIIMTLTPIDVVIPKMCPVFGIPLVSGTGKMTAGSPTLDEIVPGLGYVPGNVQVISNKANTMKSNATPLELKQFAAWVRETYGE